jgi:hypothetical protein
MVRAGAGIFDKQEPEPHKNGPVPQHCLPVPCLTHKEWLHYRYLFVVTGSCFFLIYPDIPVLLRPKDVEIEIPLPNI